MGTERNDLEVLLSAYRQIAREEALKVVEEARIDITSDRYMTIAEAAQVSGYKPQTLRKWLSAKKLRNHGRRGSPRVLLSDVLNLQGR